MYDPQKIEPKWQKKWADKKTFEPNLKDAPKPFYNLMMFPYPSGKGLHVGHTYAFGGADAFGRYQRLQGQTVFEPMGFDAFGIHSENFAIKQGMHPRELIDQTTAYYREKQMKRYGGMWDWSRQVDTTQPDYYRWTQWIFTQFFKGGLAERKKQALNWCPSCKTVLSDEQVELKEGKNVCERCKTVVERKEMEQWFFKITDYSEELLDYHDTDWSETTKTMQTNWIGRSEGARINFQVVGQPNWQIEVYTTRPDTLFGATFFVLAPEHPLVRQIMDISPLEKKLDIENYLKRVSNKSAVDRQTAKEKIGVDTWMKVVNPVNGEELPIFVADYVLMDYGTGAIMGVPAHDQRDWEFAKNYGLSIRPVIDDGQQRSFSEKCWDGVGKLTDSGDWTGWEMPKQVGEVIDWLDKHKLGQKSVQFKLRDWCISRQRYWGPPIPLIHCSECAAAGKSWFNSGEGHRQARKLGKKDRFDQLAKSMAGWYPVPDDQLPVELPFIEDYQPKGKGQSPLADLKGFSEVDCPHCGKKAKRETDVSDTFLDSAWYFLRYPSVGNDKVPFDPELTKKWLPVDSYIGGNEHAVLHLLYCRFVTMALHDLGFIEFKEPFKRFFAHGLIIKDGAKMSKSRGNVINPEEYIDKYGADALRMYLLFLGPINQGGDFRDTGMQGMVRFLKRLYQLANESADKSSQLTGPLKLKLHQTIKKMGDDFSKMKFNTAIAALMELTNTWTEHREAGDMQLVGVLARLIAPVAPHLAEEFWEMAGGKLSVLDAGWPEYDSRLFVQDQVSVVVQINGKTRGEIVLSAQVAKMATDIDKKKVVDLITQAKQFENHLDGRDPSGAYFVPNRLVNVTVGQRK